MEVAFRMHEVGRQDHKLGAAQWQVRALVRHADHAVLGLADFGEVGRKTLPDARDHQMGACAGHPAVQRGNDVRVGVRGDQVRQAVGREVLGHAHEQLVERQITARIDDRAGVAVDNQELIGLHGGPIFFDEIGKHQAGMALVSVEFDGFQ
ncbi:hypothetical protein SDC9_81031 [bioreactor metagenome]|uniref:Uncharacterized protein n=1 Tax=bioreactor metagenome TaxID=1076179 RepID=A0A644Z2E5_9ZZZZ